MKKFKFIVATALIGTMMFGMCACGGDKTDSDKSEKETEVEVTVEESEVSEETEETKDTTEETEVPEETEHTKIDEHGIPDDTKPDTNKPDGMPDSTRHSLEYDEDGRVLKDDESDGTDYRGDEEKDTTAVASIIFHFVDDNTKPIPPRKL